MNIKTPSVVAMVLLLNMSRDNNGKGALEGGRRTMEKERGQSPPYSTCTAKSHAYIAKCMEMERCEMRPTPVWWEHFGEMAEIRAFGHLTLWRTQRFSLTSTDAGKNRNAPSHKAGKSKIYI